MRRYAAPVVLALAFAVVVQLCVVLGGRVPAAPLVTVLASGALVVVLLVTPAPLRKVRLLGRREALMAAGGGLLAVLGAPALVLGLRMSDAPAGSIIVFLMSGGWAAVVALIGGARALRARRRLSAAWTVAGSLLVLAGAAGVVACWERPSSFSPFVRFAAQEAGMLLGGVLLIGGGLLLARAARGSDPGAVLIWAAASAVVAAAVWWVATGFDQGWSSLAEQPVAVLLAAVAWGVFSVSWVDVLQRHDPAVASVSLAVTPVLLSALTLVEKLVGVAGPQPLVFPGVAAGSLLIAAGCAALAHSVTSRAAVPYSRTLTLAAAAPLALAAVALALPAIAVDVAVVVTGGDFAGAWSLSGAESVFGLSVLALTVLVVVASIDARPFGPATAALVAGAALPWLADVPTHVWSSALAPEIQHYYGTEYGTITFTATPGIPLIAAAALSMLFLLVIMVIRRDPADRRIAAGIRHGGS